MKRLIVPLAALVIAVPALGICAMGYATNHRASARIAELREQTRQIEEHTAEIRAQAQHMRSNTGNEVQGTYVPGQMGSWSSGTAGPPVSMVTSGVMATTGTYTSTSAGTSMGTSMGNNVVFYSTSQPAREYEQISIDGVARVGYRTAEGGITVDQNCTPHTYTPEQHLDLVAGGIGGSVAKSFPVGEPVEGKLAHRHKNEAPSQFAAR